jgi:hypothetical protein
MTINLTGPLDKPSFNLTGPLFQPGNQGTQGNPLQQLIPGLQPKQPLPNTGNTPQNQPQANDPLQQLLNGLQKPQQQPQQQQAPQPQQQPQPANPLAPILQNLLGQPQN